MPEQAKRYLNESSLKDMRESSKIAFDWIAGFTPEKKVKVFSSDSVKLTEEFITFCLSKDTKLARAIKAAKEGKATADEKESIDNMILCLGAYLGETVIKNFGGKWTFDDSRKTFSVTEIPRNAGGLITVFPMSKITKRFFLGKEDSIAWWYQGTEISIKEKVYYKI
ncbi:MAG TPA: hypothetical protein VI933_03015 [archaeon]|nr:hypothetical protein [archaeon]